jgi:hypothetical protein
LERMTHVKGTRDVGWRKNDAERLPSRCRIGPKVPALEPRAIPPSFNTGRVVRLR